MRVVLTILSSLLVSCCLSSVTGCNDFPSDWMDDLENDCDWYEEFPKTRCSWATPFAKSATPATVACCACGGGKELPPATGSFYMRNTSMGRWLSVSTSNPTVRLGFRNANAIIDIEPIFNINSDPIFALKTSVGRRPYIGITGNGVVATLSSPYAFYIEDAGGDVWKDGSRVKFVSAETGETIIGMFGGVVETGEINSGHAEFQLQAVNSDKKLRKNVDNTKSV